MTYSEIVLTIIAAKLLGVIVQLQRLMPLFKEQIIATNESNRGVRALLAYFGLHSDDSPIATAASSPARPPARTVAGEITAR